MTRDEQELLVGDPVDQARRGFLDRYGCVPEGIWSAPGRVNLIGDHTDYNEGLVLPMAIEKRTAVALRCRSDGRVRITSSTLSECVEGSIPDLLSGPLTGWWAYPLGVARALLPGRRGASEDAGGFDVMIASNVPLGAGLASSAALECAMSLAINERWNLGLDRLALAEAGQFAENVVVGTPTGLMDQCAALMCAPGQALLLDCRTGETRQIPLQMADCGVSLLVIDTRIPHHLAVGEYAIRRRECRAAADALGLESLGGLGPSDLPAALGKLDGVSRQRVRHVVTENARVAQTAEVILTQGVGLIGDLLVASHHSLRDDFAVSCPALDLAVDAAMTAGALGARMTGAGMGGSAIALVRTGDMAAVADSVIAEFRRHRLERPTVFEVRPDAPARRDG